MKEENMPVKGKIKIYLQIRQSRTINIMANIRKYNTFKINHQFIYFYFIIIANLLLSIISDLSINMRIYLYYSYSYYRIINIKNIGEPSEIYVDSDKIETKSNIQYYS